LCRDGLPWGACAPWGVAVLPPYERRRCVVTACRGARVRRGALPSYRLMSGGVVS